MIKISPKVSVSYALVQEEPIVLNDRITGYFAGTISGMETHIPEYNYTTQGQLEIDTKDKHQFEF